MTSKHSKPLLTQGQRKAIILSLAIAATIYLAVVISTGYTDTRAAFLKLGISGWALLFSCSLFSFFLRFVRWQGYISEAGAVIPTGRHFLYYLTGFALTTTPGKAGETIRSLLLYPHGVAYPVSLASFFTERFLDVIVVAILASLTVFAFEEYLAFVLTVTAIILLLLPLIRSPVFLSILASLQNRLHQRRIKNTLAHLAELVRNAHLFLSWKRITSGLLLGLTAWSIQGLAFYFILSTLELEIGLLAAVGIFSVSLLAGAVSFIPGGVGSTEVVMGLLLAALGADTAVAVSAPLISRLSTLWFAVMLGLLSAFWLGYHRD
jgi:uncharacterized protein (TIRG00374 family)